MRHLAIPSLPPALLAAIAVSAPLVAQVRSMLTADDPFPFTVGVFAHDDARSRLIVALPDGGVTEWDGSTWAISLVKIGGQPISVAYDPTRRRTFFGTILGSGLRLVEYDGVTAIDRGPVPSVAPTFTVDVARGRLIALGVDVSGKALVLEWDGTSWTQPTPATLPDAFVVQSAAYDENRNVTVALLENAMRGFPSADTWEWNGIDWTLRRFENLQPFGPIAYDPTRRQVVTASVGARAWNGTTWTPYTSQVLSDEALAVATDRRSGRVWRLGSVAPGAALQRLDAAGWTAVAPRMHSGRGMIAPRPVFHEARNQLVVFDGFSGRTAVWDGFRWSEAPSAPASLRRDQHSMVYDSARAKVVLFGGFDTTTGLVSGDTWTWDGTWQQVATSGPPPQAFAAIADDRSRGRVVLLCDLVSGLGTPSRWEWDGSIWRQVGTPPPVPPISFFGFGYDELRQRLVLDIGFGVFEEVGGQWQQSNVLSPGAARPNLVWNVARQRLQMSSAGGAIVEYDGQTWQTLGAEIGEIAYDRARNVLLAFGTNELAQWSDNPAAAFDVGRGCGGATTLAPFGLPRVGNAAFHVDFRAAGGQQFAGIVLGLASGNQQLGGGCAYYVQQEIASIVALTNDAGFLHQPLAIPAQTAFLGVAVMLQGGGLDAQSPIGVALSPGLRLVLGD